MKSDRAAAAPAAGFQFHRARRELVGPVGPIHLPPKSLDVLIMLIDRAGEILTREDLVREAWGGLAVSADAVRYTLRQLRKALDDSVDAPEYIETVARRGWRFVASLEAMDDGVLRLLPKSRDLAGAGGLRSGPPLVGREAEWGELTQALDQAMQIQSQAVFVTGEAGIGKTSLLERFVHQAATRGDVVVARGDCVEFYGAGQPYLPLLEILERVCSALGGGLPVATLRRHAPTWLGELPSLTEPDEREELARQNQGASQSRMIREFAEVMKRLSDRHTLVLWVEDLQWADDSTLEALSYLVRQLTGRGILLLGSMRPASARADEHGAGATLDELVSIPHCRRIEPAPLRAAEIGEYLAVRFGGEFAPSRSVDFVSHLREVSSGNPLFAVSLVDDLLDRNAVVREAGQWTLMADPERLPVPDRIEPLLRRQIEALGAEEHALLEVASVAGLEFSVLELAPALGADLDALERLCDRLVEEGRFVRPAGAASWPDGRVGSRYRFVHSLHREALRTAISAGRLSRTHRVIAEEKERGYAGQVDEIASELADHFERGQVPARAFEYSARAGEASAARSSNREAVALLRHALDLVSEIPEADRWFAEVRVRLSICAPLASVVGYGGAELGENLGRLAVLTADVEDSPAMFPALLGLWALHATRADIDAAEELGQRLIALADKEDDAVVRLQAHRSVGHVLFYRGRLEASQEHLDHAVKGFERSDHPRFDYSIGDDPVVLVHAFQAWTNWFRGFPERAIDHSDEAERQAMRLGHPPSLGFALSYGSVLHLLRRDVARAWEWSERAQELARTEGMPIWFALSEVVRGACFGMEGDLVQGITHMREGVAGWIATGSELGLPYFQCLLASALGQAGASEEANSVLLSADEVIDRTGQHIFRVDQLRVGGELECERATTEADIAAGLRAMEEAARSAKGFGALSLELRARLAQVDVLDLHGDSVALEEPQRPLAQLADCYHRFTEGTNDPDLQRAAERLGLRG